MSCLTLHASILGPVLVVMSERLLDSVRYSELFLPQAIFDNPFFYFLTDRYFWDPYDPQSVCEAIFSIGNILSFSRFTYIMALDANLGPLQLSLGLMAKVGFFLYNNLDF